MIISEKTKTSKKQLLAAIALVLALAFAASFITALPIAFGQAKIIMTSEGVAFPPIVGVGQTVILEGVPYPLPENYVGSVVFAITKPDKTVQNITVTLDKVGEATIDYVPDKVGTWSFRVLFDGDAKRTSATSSSYSWTVQTAQTSPQAVIPMYADVSVVPTTIGLGQGVYIVGWVTPPRELSGGVFQNLEYTITKPDGTTYTVVADSNSEASNSFASNPCDQTGIWSVKLRYAGDRFHTSAESSATTWTVLTEYVVPMPPKVPLPVGPWTYPISCEYVEWYQISGSWIDQNAGSARTNFNAFTKGPESPHILWTKPTTAVGIFGETGYSGMFGGGSVPVAAFGRLYYLTTDGGGSTQHPVVTCLDQTTGALVWKSALPIEPNKPAAGANIFIEMQTRVKVDPKLGERPQSVFSLWVTGGGVWEIDPADGTTINFFSAITATGAYYKDAIYFSGWNGTTNKAQSGVVTKFLTRTMVGASGSAAAVAWTAAIPSFNFVGEGVLMRGTQGRGQIPYGQQTYTWSTDTGDVIVNGTVLEVYSSESAGRTCIAYGKWFFHSSTDARVHAVDLYTGQEAWVSEPNEHPWGVFGSYVVAAGYGNYYQGSWDGYLSCYDAATGATKWRTYLGDNIDTAMGHNVPWGQPIIGGGKIYVTSSEHTYPTPIPRGELLYCMDAYTGNILWTMPFAGTTTTGGISSGILFTNNQYDGLLYNFGVGETATTVSASPAVIANGASVLIQGTVTDQSAGAKGTPAVSEASMEQQMIYLYQNGAAPTNNIGVPVSLVAIDSQGTVTDITHVTTDSSGQFSYMWNPPTQGTYTIVASFDGSNSYYSSYGETSVGVTAAPPPTPTPQANIATTEQVAQTNTYLLGATIAIIIVVLAATIINLRKRK